MRERLYASTTNTYDETADLDLIAIERALNGEPTRLTMNERLYAARFLDERGLDVTAIAGRLGTSTAMVRGWKENGWKPGGAPKREKRPDPVCGEPRMYRRHLKNGESCSVCRAANAAADRRYRLVGSRTASA
ncbi:hypothetical protein AB0420_02205 [Streptomyces caelestis]|uniref:hypothetical protein n=1 Tax=Streptomyces caelestis TaxID=36816 RepID=UPI00344D12C1